MAQEGCPVSAVDSLMMDAIDRVLPSLSTRPVAAAAQAIVRDATFSPCGTFRYTLWRQWDATLPTLILIMLNPSTASELIDDPTIRKGIGFAKRNGFGSLLVFNLYAFRATDPRDLKAGGYQVGPENDERMFEVIAATHRQDAGKVVCAWGANVRAQRPSRRAHEVRISLIERGVPLHYLQLTKDGIPSHPLMLPYSCEIQEWKA